MGKIPQGWDNLIQAWSQGGPQGRPWGGYGEREWWTLTLQLWHSLSPHSVCKKSPNLLAALLPLLDLSLKQCWRWVWPCAGKVPWGDQAWERMHKILWNLLCYALNLNDKGPSMKWVCFPKVLWSFSYLTLTQNKPSEFFECYLFDYYCLTMIDELSIYISVLFYKLSQ